MTQTAPPPRPAPPPHSRRPLEDWAAAREDFESGCSMRIVAERHGLNPRTASRHARAEGWRSPRIEAAHAWAMAEGRSEYDPTAVAEGIAVAHMVEHDLENLLICPDTIGLCRFAFRRAAECAGVSGPTEALAWVRLGEAVARLRRQVDVDVRPMSDADYRRINALAHVQTGASLDALRQCDAELQADQDAAKVSEVSESVP